ncbi:hypothetical protein G6F56_007485 [Rhizopus delemar]|nr:hypothetical protein G6F56_007485 [Rhizopus delemar]
MSVALRDLRVVLKDKINTNSLTTSQRLPEATVLISPLNKRTHSDRLSVITSVASRPTLQPIAESCVTSNPSLHNQTPETTNNEMQSSIKEIYNILEQHDARSKEFKSLLNENKQLRRDLAQAQELIQQLREALPKPFVLPAPEAGTEASRYAAVAAKAITTSQPSRQQKRLTRFSRHQKSTPTAREAVTRNFLPISETQGFSFIYLHLRGKEPMSAMSMRLCRLKLQSSRILDIHYPTNNIVARLVDNDYYQEAIQTLEMQQITCLPDFVPFSEQHLPDPRYHDKPIEERQSAAQAIFYQRLTNIALRVQHDNRKFAVAHDFRKNQWITEEQYVFIARSIRPPRDIDLRDPGTRSNSLGEMDTDDSDSLLCSALLTNLNGPADGDNSTHLA